MNKQAPIPAAPKRAAALAKKILLIAAGALVAFIAVLLLLNWLLPEKEQPPSPEIYFYPVEEGNIFENPQYLGKNRFIYYCDDPNGYGLTEQITDEDRDSFDIKVRFVEIYLNSLMSGDQFTMRSLFTERYLQEKGIPQFTQQMLYNMYIYHYKTENLDGGVTQVTYKVNYMIYRNNGTYRRDVGSDGAKPEYLVLLVYPDGTIKIDNILR